MKIILKVFFMLMTLSFMFKGVLVNADDLGFSVSVHPSDKQRDTKVPYLDLRMKPSEISELKITVKNESSTEDLIVHFNYSNATTNSDGGLEYIPYTMKNDDSLEYRFEDIVEGPNEETLKPNEEKTIIFKVTMPEKKFDGYIAGGIEIEQVKETSEKGIIETEFSYVIGAKISETDKIVKNEIEYKKVQVELYNNYYSIMIYLANVTNSYVEGMTTEVEITEINQKEILLSTKKENMRMAPNSQIAFPLSLKDKMLDSGTYEAHIKVTTEDGFNKAWSRPFKVLIEKGSSYRIEETTESQTNKSYSLYVVIFLLCTIGVGSILLFYFKTIRKRRRNKNDKKRRKKK